MNKLDILCFIDIHGDVKVSNISKENSPVCFPFIIYDLTCVTRGETVHLIVVLLRNFPMKLTPGSDGDIIKNVGLSIGV